MLPHGLQSREGNQQALKAPSWAPPSVSIPVKATFATNAKDINRAEGQAFVGTASGAVAIKRAEGQASFSTAGGTVAARNVKDGWCSGVESE